MLSISERFVCVAGAPRCGTTTISKLLRSHPQVSFSRFKEPHFFSQHDLRGLSDDQLRERVERDYLARFFKPGPREHSVRAEGSVTYLYTPEQMEPLLRLWPNAKFIVSVRDPMTMLPSLHQRLIYNGDETILRFEDAWQAIPDRAAGRRIPRSCVDPRWLRYDEAGRVATYLERFFAAVGRENCLVVVFDDLVANPEAECRRIMDFAGLDPVEPIEVPVVRASRGVRYPWLQRLLKRPPKPLRPYFASLPFRARMADEESRPANGAAGANGDGIDKLLSLRKRLLRWNTIEQPKAEIPMDIQQEIRLQFRDEVERLGTLIGRDLSHWLQPADGSSSEESP